MELNALASLSIDPRWYQMGVLFLCIRRLATNKGEGPLAKPMKIFVRDVGMEKITVGLRYDDYSAISPYKIERRILEACSQNQTPCTLESFPILRFRELTLAFSKLPLIQG
jgi:hypothetical protein